MEEDALFLRKHLRFSGLCGNYIILRLHDIRYLWRYIYDKIQ